MSTSLSLNKALGFGGHVSDPGSKGVKAVVRVHLEKGAHAAHVCAVRDDEEEVLVQHGSTWKNYRSN